MLTIFVQLTVLFISIQQSKYYQTMQKAESNQPRNFTKRHYSTVITTGLPTIQSESITAEQPLGQVNSKPQFRRTDHTDGQASQITNSQMIKNCKSSPKFQSQEQYNFRVPNNNSNGGRYELGPESQVNSTHNNNNNEQHYNNLAYNYNTSLRDHIIQKQRGIVELRERLKNIHQFYRVRIEEERVKNITRSEIFVGIIDDLQEIHSHKIMVLQQTYQQSRENQNQASLADERVQKMKKNIQHIIEQSQKLKSNNEVLEQQLIQKRSKNQQKQQQLINSKQQLEQLQGKLEQFERAKLKQNRKNKELLEMMTHIFQ